MTHYTQPDFFALDELFDDDQRLIRQTVRRFVDDRVMPGIAQHARAGTFPLDIVPEMGRLGMFGANLEGHGCADLGAIAYGLINQELERGDSGVRSFVSVQSSLCMWPIHTFGTEEQKERWLPAMARGEKVGCFGLTEAESGSDPGSMKTTARRDGGDYVLNGAKMWITNGSIADVAIVWAKLDGAVRGFLVEKGMRGFSAPQIHNKFSLRASVTSELVFEDVRVPLENLLPGSEIGLRAALECLNQARYSIVWGAVGAASACYDEALRYARERRQFDRPIARFQLVQQKLVWMITEITKAQLLAFRLGRLKESGKAKHYHVSMGKLNNVSVALKCARLAREILGAAGIIDDYQCSRHLCNLESVYTYEGTHDIHTLVVGEAVTGERALY
ncbi:MAG TPA: acyl-CoA dehydrogenase family protein [Phycisphaerae bacterium]|nr:acyl-CoA dehydrogenase family protein [Phycisphaerales bacterium]HRX84003.1 acyl-CoA dehydrogenase family protein [Phycisphaerae bacterium]